MKHSDQTLPIPSGPVYLKDIDRFLELSSSTVGSLELLAGIGPDHASRAAFWKPWAKLPVEDCFAAFRSECRSRIRARVEAGEMSLVRL